MMKYLLFCILFTGLFLLVACTSTELGACSQTPSVTWTKWPVRLQVDQTENVDFSLNPSLRTPYGTFSISDPIPLISSNRVLLIIENRSLPAHQQRIAYCLNLGRSIRVVTNGTTVIDVNSNGYVLIDVTESSIDTIEIYDTNIIEFDTDSNLPICGGIMSSFRVGDQANVDIDLSSSQPRPKIYTHYTHHGNSNEALANLQQNDVLTLVDGPYCYRNIWFWQINSTILARDFRNIDAWVAEAAPHDRYLCPISMSSC